MGGRVMRFDVKNRFTGAVQFTAEIVCAESAPLRVKRRLAVLWAIRNGADLRGANLRGVNLRGANLRGADLSGADLSGADLRGANLRGVNLRGANLRGADLSGADMRGADMRGSNLICVGHRSDGYEFYAHIRDGKIWIKAGCRYFSITDAARHWRNTRAGTQLGEESQQLLRNARALVKIRGLLGDTKEARK
jgi:hypothetical protein